MKRQFLRFVTVATILVATLDCTQSQPRETSRPVQNLTGDEISRLDNGVTVTFSATLGVRSDNNCVEVFIPDEFRMYNGDAKWAIPSRFAFPAAFSEQFAKGQNVIVTARMTFVKDSPDPRKTCGIITGRLFEVTEIH